MKKYRAPKAKPGELKMQYGKLPYDNPDICYVWGDGCNGYDGRLLHNVFSSERPFVNISTRTIEYGQSFIKELVERGYDITTIKFSIQKKRGSNENKD